MLVYFTAFGVFFYPFGVLCGHLEYFGMLYEEKSGNPGAE
jgi:hypothetical protein